MNADPQAGRTQLQEAVYRVALSLEAFFVNGIQYGVLRHSAFDGFLQKTSGNLLRDLASLEEQDARVSQARLSDLLAALKTKCGQAIHLAAEMTSFRRMPLQQVRASVSQLQLLRQACVQGIEAMETRLGTAKPFYSSRPSHAAASVNGFLDHLERSFTEEWTAANGVAKE